MRQHETKRSLYYFPEVFSELSVSPQLGAIFLLSTSVEWKLQSLTKPKICWLTDANFSLASTSNFIFFPLMSLVCFSMTLAWVIFSFFGHLKEFQGQNEKESPTVHFSFFPYLLLVWKNQEEVPIFKRRMKMIWWSCKTQNPQALFWHIPWFFLKLPPQPDHALSLMKNWVSSEHKNAILTAPCKTSLPLS